MNQNIKRVAAGLMFALFLSAGYQEDARSYSCHLCRNTKTQEVRRFWFVPIGSSKTVRLKYPLAAGHQHNWYGYSRFQAMGYRGWVGASIACSANQYRDGKRPP